MLYIMLNIFLFNKSLLDFKIVQNLHFKNNIFKFSFFLIVDQFLKISNCSK